jgi:hypothetical protein
MKKIIIILFTFSMFFLFSCPGEDDIAYADVTIHNNSDYTVTDLLYYQEDYTKPATIASGAKLVDQILWAPNGPFPYQISYKIGEVIFNSDHMEGKLWTEKGKHFYSPFVIMDGAKVTVYIENDGWRQEMVGGKYVVVK